MTDYRSLLAELMAWAEKTSAHYIVHPDVMIRAYAALDEPGPEAVDGVTSDYIDPEHTGADRDMLEVFYSACRSEGGTADEIHLRGLRAVLARWGRPAPVPAETTGPTVAELRQIFDDYSDYVFTDDAPVMWATDFYRAARYIFARWGNHSAHASKMVGQPAPPAAGADCPACEGVPKPGNQPCAVCGRSASSAGGEVAELVACLRRASDGASAMGWEQDSWIIARAADLLERQASPVPMPPCESNWDSILSPSGGYEMAEDAALRDGAQLVNGEWWAPVFGCDSLESALGRIRERLQRQAAPVPVAVNERLPQPEDCDAEGRCWVWDVCTDSWVLYPAKAIDLVSRQHRVNHWLPATALPLPQGEVEP